VCVRLLQIEARLPPLVLTLFIREILFPFDTIPLSSPLLPFISAIPPWILVAFVDLRRVPGMSTAFIPPSSP
jgi:hypothetical protein